MVRVNTIYILNKKYKCSFILLAKQETRRTEEEQMLKLFICIHNTYKISLQSSPRQAQGQ